MGHDQTGLGQAMAESALRDRLEEAVSQREGRRTAEGVGRKLINRFGPQSLMGIEIGIKGVTIRSGVEMYAFSTINEAAEWLIAEFGAA